MKIVLTCEHAGNEIPKQYREIFKNEKEVLNSHRGFDTGALDLFHSLQKIADYSEFNTISRLLVEVNRSQSHPQLFSEFSRNFSTEEKKNIMATFYFPYRNSIENRISEFLAAGDKVVHLSVHSFTPELDGVERQADVGLLYDPKKITEKDFCRHLKKQLLQQDQSLRIRFNYPYLGKADGFTTYLRKKFQKNYMGIEVEINQKFAVENKFPSHLKMSFLKAVSYFK